MHTSRFRWSTFNRALDVLARIGQADLVAIIEEHGCGPEYDALKAFDRTSPKMRNMLASVVRRTPSRTDSEGDLLADS